MGSLSWGSPTGYTRTRYMQVSQFKNYTHEAGKIYTVLTSYRQANPLAKKVSQSDFDRLLEQIEGKLAGKARILYARIDSDKKTFMYQYVAITAFVPMLAGWLVYLIIATVIAAILLIILSVLGVDVGEFISTGITKPITGAIGDTVKGIATSPYVLGALLIGGLGYALLKNPDKIGEVRKQFYGRY